MLAVSSLLIAEDVKPDDNGNVSAIGVMDNFTLTLPRDQADDDYIESAGRDYGGPPGAFVCWSIPASHRREEWEGKLEIWANGQRRRNLGRSPVDTSTHSARWVVQLDGLPIYTQGEHELRAYCRPVTDPPAPWPAEPAGVYPYMVIVQPIPGRTGKAGTTPATTSQGTPTPAG